MRPTLAFACFILVLLALSFATRTSVASASGRALYQSRCAECHGRSGEGKSAIKAPSLVSAEVRNMSDGQLRERILQRTNGELERVSAHARMKQRLNADQVKELTRYIRAIQRQKMAGISKTRESPAPVSVPR